VSAAREARMGLGRGWAIGGESGGGGNQRPGQAALQATIFSSRGALNETPSIVFMTVDVKEMLGDALWKYVVRRANESAAFGGHNDPSVWEQLRTAYVPFNVTHVFADASGKFAGNAETVMVVDFDALTAYVGANMSPNAPRSLREQVAQLNLSEYAINIVVNLPPDERVSTYLDTNTDSLTKTVTLFGSIVLFESGFAQIRSSMPCIDAMSTRWALSLVLSLILDIIAAVLLFLSGVLVYALLGVDVERRTSELGILRLLGSERRRLVLLLLAHASAYSLATVVGLILAQCVMPFIAMAMSLISGAPVPSLLSFDGVWRAVLLGVGMPILAGVVPISNALQRSVASAFEARDSVKPPVVITIERSESGAISAPLLVGGLFCAAFGFGIYYLLPLSLLSLNIELLVDLFVALLCGMLLGMVVLSLNVSTLLQRALGLLLVSWWERDIVGVLLGKHLVAHQARHRKTVVVFAVSIAFIIFLSVSYSIQIDETRYQELQQTGADLLCSTLLAAPASAFVRELLLNATASEPAVDAFAWTTPPLTPRVQRAAFALGSARNRVVSSQIKTLGALKSSEVDIFGVPPNFFNVTDSRFLQISGMSPADAVDIIARELYGHDRAALIGAADAKKLNTAVGDSLQLQAGSAPPVLFRVAGILDQAPLFQFSRFNRFTPQAVLISLPEYASLRDLLAQTAARDGTNATDGLQDTPFGSLVVRFKRRAGAVPAGAVDRLTRQLRTASLSSAAIMTFRDAEASVAKMTSTTLVIFGFFGFATVMAMTISFFALVSSTYVTVMEQRREIGVLRAVGISKWRLLRCYIYEALIVVLSAVMLGLVIGIAMGWTMSAQRVLFSQLPIPFAVPWTLFLLMCALSVLFGAVSACLPLRGVLKRNPVEIMRARD
jgi:ABC-type antimicrobial peptide transport system permease subunit